MVLGVRERESEGGGVGRGYETLGFRFSWSE